MDHHIVDDLRGLIDARHGERPLKGPLREPRQFLVVRHSRAAKVDPQHDDAIAVQFEQPRLAQQKDGRPSPQFVPRHDHRFAPRRTRRQ